MTIIVRSNEPTPQNAASISEGTKTGVVGETEPKAAPEANASEQNPSSESATGETEEANATAEQDGATPEGEEPDGDAESENESETDKDKAAPGKKKGGFQRRIDKLNAQKAAAQQELEYWKQQALKGAGATKQDAPKADQAQAAQAPDAGKPNPDAFDSHAAYVEALTDWKVEQKEQAREQKLEQSRLQAEQKKQAKSYQERAQAFAAKQADFQDVLSEVDGIPVSPAVQSLILESEHGPALAYELAKNPDEFERVNRLAPLAAAREMGKLEARIASRTSSEKKPEPKKVTQAPKPLEPVKAGKGSASKSIFDSSLSQAEYERLRREQQKRR